MVSLDWGGGSCGSNYVSHTHRHTHTHTHTHTGQPKLGGAAAMGIQDFQTPSLLWEGPPWPLRWLQVWRLFVCVCVCLRVCARARARVRACVVARFCARVDAHVCVKNKIQTQPSTHCACRWRGSHPPVLRRGVVSGRGKGRGAAARGLRRSVTCNGDEQWTAPHGWPGC